MSQPVVTIVTPSYNQGRFIRATIESVLAQDYPGVEYIIMDGGSTDETAAVVKDYSSRVVFVSERDRGQSHAINKGFQRARGEVLAWINSDDILLRGAVGKAVGAFGDDARIGAVYGEGYLMDEAGHLTARFPYTQPFDLWRLTHLSDYILQQSVFFRKHAVAEVGWLREELHYTMDWDLLIRIGKRYPLRRIPEYLGCIRDYGDTKTSLGGMRRVKEIRRLLCEHTGLRVPPGWVLYGIGAWSDLWCRRIQRVSPPRLRWATELLQVGLLGLCSAIVGRVVNRHGGWHADGWIGQTMEYWLPHGTGPLVLDGEMPPSPWLQGQHVKISCNGAVLGDFPVPPGRLRLTVAVPAPADGEPVRLQLECARTFVPGYSWENNLDVRALALLLHSIQFFGFSYFPPGRDPEFPRPAPRPRQQAFAQNS